MAGTPGLAVATGSGGRVTLLWMDPSRLSFRYVPGTRWPEGSPATTADRTPSTWTTTMVAAFNSGYKLSDHVGGYWYRGRTVSPLRAGLGTFTVDADGTLHVGVWGRDLGLTPSTVAVRQNERPLVLDGVSQASAHDGPNTWGKAVGNRRFVNRSALAVLPDGSFVFAVAEHTTASVIGAALAALHVRVAVMLDMNGTWPTGYLYRHRGGRVTGVRIAPWLHNPPSVYLTRYKKDFVVVSPRV